MSDLDLTTVVRQLRETGVAVIHDFLSPQELDDTRSACRQLIDQAVESAGGDCESSGDLPSVFVTGKGQTADRYFLQSVDRISYFYEPTLDSSGRPSVNKIGHALHHEHAHFRKITFSSRMRQLARALDLQRPVVAQSMLIMKNARVGGKVHAHKDATYLYTEPETRLVGLWMPLDACDQQNGCLWYVPGSHRDLRRQRFVRKDSLATDAQSTELDRKAGSDSSLCTTVDEHLEQSYPPEAFVPLELPAGSCVLIDGFVVHESHENRSDRSRPAFTLHLVDLPEGVEWSAGNWLQPNDHYQFPLLL
jgi:phytanoyl-CoA hydroxylase